jgi:predicted DNA-binding transcriptional regulator YafY
MVDYINRRLRELDLARQLLAMIRHGTPFTFRYQEGTTPGQLRTVLPVFLFIAPPDYEDEASNPEMEPLHLLAYCFARNAARTFYLGSIEPASTPKQTA